MRRMPGRVSAAPGLGRGARRLAAAAGRLAVVVGSLAFLAGPLAAQDGGGGAEPKAPPKIDAEEAGSAQAGGKDVKITVRYPSGEKDGKRWAESLRAVCEKSLPALGKAAAFAPANDALEVKYAFGPEETDGYDAALRDGTLYCRKNTARKDPGMYRAGFRNFWVTYALARLWADQVARPEWLRAGVAHLLVYRALKEAPQLYDARTYRDELLEEMKKRTDEGPLDQWSPAPPLAAESGVVSSVEHPVPAPEAAAVFAFLYEIDVSCDQAVLKAIAEAGAGGTPIGGKDFQQMVIKAAGERGGPNLFIGWASGDPQGTLTPKLDKLDVVDSDSDGLLNFEEVIHGTDKAKPDTDGDGVLDGEEVEDGTNPAKKDVKRSKVKLDGDPKEWLRLKKFTFQDKEGDAKEKITGADVKFVKICSDAKNIYLLLEADSFENADVAYQICFDAGDDGVPMDSNNPDEQKKAVWNYVVGFRGDGSKWMGETHNVKDWSWAQWKNHRRLLLHVKDNFAEIRIPLSSMELPQKFLFMVYTTAKDGALVADSVLRQPLDLSKFRIDE